MRARPSHVVAVAWLFQAISHPSVNIDSDNSVDHPINRSVGKSGG